MHFFPGKKNKTNKEAIEQIILDKYNQYYRLAYSYVHNEADAGDIVQNGAYKAIRSSHTLKNMEYAEKVVNGEMEVTEVNDFVDAPEINKDNVADFIKIYVDNGEIQR